MQSFIVQWTFKKHCDNFGFFQTTRWVWNGFIKNPNSYCLLIARTENCRNLLRYTLAVTATYNFYYISYHDANDDFVIPTASLLTAVTSLLYMTSTLREENNFPWDNRPSSKFTLQNGIAIIWFVWSLQFHMCKYLNYLSTRT